MGSQSAGLSSLLAPLPMESLDLKNRVVMASLTRNRDATPREDLHVPYYEERASVGLIVGLEQHSTLSEYCSEI